MARGKQLTEEEIETYYMLILEYGQDKGGMSYVNKKLQEMLHPKKSIEEIRDHFRRANPNDEKCTPERKIKFEKMKAARSGQKAFNKSIHYARRTLDLQELLYSIDLTTLKSNLGLMEGKEFFDAFLAIHKTISTNVSEEIAIDTLIDLLNANNAEQDNEDGTD